MGNGKPFGGHEFKKSLGQNFISDKNLLASIVRDSGAGECDTIIEVGAGAGTLTEELAKTAKKVISFEVDNSLKERLGELEEKYDNLTIIFKDILNVSLAEINELVGKKSYKLVANIPYYITTPIIMKFIEDKNCEGITVMVQKEVAERIASKPDKGDYGAISAVIQVVGEARLARVVKKQNFYPIPKVDSAVLTIALNADRNISEVKEIFGVIRSAFKNRRKKLSSNIAEDYKKPKEKIEELLVQMGFSETARAEELSSADYIILNNLMKTIK